MALQGKYTYYTYSSHDSEVETITVTFPNEMDPLDSNYDKRGTTQDIEVPTIELTPTIYENCVIGLRTVNSYVLNSDDSGNKVVRLDYHYRIYDSIESKKNEYDESHLAEYYNTCTVNLDDYPNLWEYAYNQIKAQKGGEELINI